MKISQLLASVLVLLCSGAAIMYSADQQKVMDVVIATHGGGQQVDASSATGLRKLNQDLDAERGTVSAERAAAVKAAEAARIEMRDSVVKRDEIQAKLEDHKSSLDGVRAEVKAMQVKVEALKESFNKAMAKITSSDALQVDASADFGEVLESIKSVVKAQEERAGKLNEELSEADAKCKKATEELAAKEVELNRLTAINDKFFTDYNKNDDEYPLLAVDARWKFVVFNAGPDSGLVPGDATPVLVK
ncbi:MAG: hypothetical protein IJ956_09720, partial [Akkermansia sp.]|nr:hypothetical protein [Akkermansia sp.]